MQAAAMVSGVHGGVHRGVHGDAQEMIGQPSHQHSGDHHQSTADANESSNGCPDCFDCMVLCSMAGASVLADPTLLVDALIAGSADLIPSATDFRSNPPPQSLFRPPISHI
jgi:hypothetical protein